MQENSFSKKHEKWHFVKSKYMFDHHLHIYLLSVKRTQQEKDKKGENKHGNVGNMARVGEGGGEKMS